MSIASTTVIPPQRSVPDLAAAPGIAGEAAVVSHTVDGLIRAIQRSFPSQRRPRATYRVQFNREFTFRQATELVPYWSSLGVSDLYASPYLKSVRGSTHGYDIVDHSTLNPDLGTGADFDSFVSVLHAHEMGHILDFVPNHMGVGTDENAWWQDVLENGPGSPYASFFDIDWDPLKSDLQCKVLLPVLGEQYGHVLESGQLSLEFQDGAFSLRYFNRRFPVAPKSFAMVLRHRMDELAAKMPPGDPHFLEYQSIQTALTHLPPRTETDPVKLDERSREKEVVKRRLQRLCEECSPLGGWIQENVEIFNGRVGDPKSFDLLDGLLDEQAFRLSFWRVAADEINYRRFFDVNELAAVCMERPAVFESAHAFVFQLLEQGQLEGLRIDHADGLYDPTAYLWQLQERRFVQLGRVAFERRFGAVDGDLNRVKGQSPVRTLSPNDDKPSEQVLSWPEVEAALKKRFALLREEDAHSPVVCPLYLVVEKILKRNERLPENWPVHGTTGYEFLNDVNGLFIAGANAKAFDAVYTKFIGAKSNFAELVYEAKRLILRASMSSELHVLGHHLDRISERNRWTRDFTLHGLIQALREVIACFPVYRTYTVGGGVLERDRRYVEQAVARAKRRNPEISGAVFDFIRDVLLLQGSETHSEEERSQWQSFVGRFQQLTGPMMAKAVEDTAYYRFNRLVSLNEVGGDPERFGIGVAEFHQHNLERQAQRPYGMLATSTHDTKRSEDVRSRINVLSELPIEWKRQVSLWARWNRRKKVKLEGELAPARNDEYLLYQTLVGTWPFEPPHGEALVAYVARIQQYMTKAVREAKRFSSWIAPNEAYERALLKFIEMILCDDPMSPFRTDFQPFTRQVAECGIWNSLGQTLLKHTSPGVPDIYQGTEFWDFTLVDPDNRRNVDYGLRQRALGDLQASLRDSPERSLVSAELLATAIDGRIKLFVHWAALEFRRRCPALFTTGDYQPVQAAGPRAEHLCAFLRRMETDAALIVVPRLISHLSEKLGTAPIGAEVWSDTELLLPSEFAGRHWRNVFTHEEIVPRADSSLAVSDVFRVFPVGLFEVIPCRIGFDETLKSTGPRTNSIL